jgi:hypothetical protein
MRTTATAQTPNAALAPSRYATDPASSVATAKAAIAIGTTEFPFRLCPFPAAVAAIAPRNDAHAIHNIRKSEPVLKARNDPATNGAAAKRIAKTNINCSRRDRSIVTLIIVSRDNGVSQRGGATVFWHDMNGCLI